MDPTATPRDDSLDVTLTLLAARQRLIDAAQRLTVLTRCRATDSVSAAQLLVEDGQLEPDQAARLIEQAHAIEARLRAIEGDEVLTDRTDQAARQALRAGLLDLRTLRPALIDEQLRAGGDSLATLVRRHLGPEPPCDATRIARSPTSEFDRCAPRIGALPEIADDAAQVGRYPVTGRLGSGGMGEVLSVLDVDLGREVAAKLLREPTDATQLRKFVLEARVTGQLEHPAIVPAYELGKTDEGQIYLTMKRVEGEELAAMIARVRQERRTQGGANPRASGVRATGKRGRGPGSSARNPPGSDRGLPQGLLELLHVFLKVCEGVAFAHSKGVIHRDLKPANIMVGAFGEVVVCDWGLAKVMGHDVDADPGQTALIPAPTADADGGLRTLDGAIMGTPAYMPPEQAQGRIDRLDQRSDVYALGAILYEMLALRPPYSGETAWDVLQQVTAGAPPSPSARVGDDWPVPWELEAAAQRAMARRRGERYPEVGALRADVAAFLGGRMLAAAHYTRWQRVKKLARRHWRTLAASTVATVSLVGALIYGVLAAYLQADVLRQERDRVDRERQRAEQREREATEQRQLAERREREAQRHLATAKQMGAVESLDTLRAAARDRLWWTPLTRAPDGRPTGRLVHLPTRARLSAAIAEIDAWRARVQSQLLDREAAFGEARARLDPGSEDEWDRLRIKVYAQLLAGIRALRASTLDAVSTRRAAYARRLARPPDRAAWAAAAARVAASPRYPNLALVPQADLVPLGPDPVTGLERFGHLGSGTLPRPARDGRLVLADDSAIVFVLIPAGRYVIGATRQTDPRAETNERPRHAVSLDAYFIAHTELTQGQWTALGGVNQSKWRMGRSLRGIPFTARHPIEQVSWIDCVERLATHGLMLPTEVQWEAAARGGTTTVWWTPDHRSLARAENLADQSTRRFLTGLEGAEPWTDPFMATAPVGRLRANPFGLFDVIGNVREWCRDRFDEAAYRQAADTDGARLALSEPGASAPIRKRACRGGSWRQRAVSGRCANRIGNAPAVRADSLGCRPCRPLTR